MKQIVTLNSFFQGAGSPSQVGRFSKWSPTNVNEIEKFMGLLLWCGLVQMPSLESYWSTKIRYKNNVVPKIMSRNGFELPIDFGTSWITIKLLTMIVSIKFVILSDRKCCEKLSKCYGTR